MAGFNLERLSACMTTPLDRYQQDLLKESFSEDPAQAEAVLAQAPAQCPQRRPDADLAAITPPATPDLVALL